MKLIKITIQVKCSNKEAKRIAKEAYVEIEENEYSDLDKNVSNAKVKMVNMTINDYIPERKRLKNTE